MLPLLGHRPDNTSFAEEHSSRSGRFNSMTHGVAVARVVEWGDDQYGIFIDYGDGGWRKYLVGTHIEALDALPTVLCNQRELRPIGGSQV